MCCWSCHAGVECHAAPMVREALLVRCLVRPSLPGKRMVSDAVLGDPLGAGMQGREAADRQCSRLNRNECFLPGKAD